LVGINKAENTFLIYELENINENNRLAPVIRLVIAGLSRHNTGGGFEQPDDIQAICSGG
jgi:hypothetical protein